MAKARPVKCVRERAIAAFKRAHPSCPFGVEAHKVRSRQIIRVRGFESSLLGMRQGCVVAEWSYSDNGSLRRVN